MVFSSLGWAGGLVYEDIQVSLEHLDVDGSFRVSLQENLCQSVRSDCFCGLELLMHSAKTGFT